MTNLQRLEEIETAMTQWALAGHTPWMLRELRAAWAREEKLLITMKRIQQEAMPFGGIDVLDKINVIIDEILDEHAKDKGE